jgi:hypothetical protein
MSESISTTRISDLPENITMQIQSNYPVQAQGQQMQGHMQMQQQPMQGQGQGMGIGQNTYVPINIHPNPYGVQQQQPTLPSPQVMNQRGMQDDYQQRLPSRDIPMDSLGYQQDEEIQQNYIPKAKLTSDYIREYEQANEDALLKHEQKKYRENKASDIFSEIQLPLLIACLYFIFQLPVITTIMYKYFSFLSVYNTDGNLNFSGLALKSTLFGLLFYLINQFSNTLTQL